MRRVLLKSKIHRATVTAADLHYDGSVTIDPALMEAADIAAYEQVQIYDITRGSRLTTYAIPGTRNSGEVCINGAAAHLVRPGDLVIICSYADYEEAEVPDHKPAVIRVDANNQIAELPPAEPSHPPAQDRSEVAPAPRCVGH